MSDEPTSGVDPLREFLSEGEEIIEKLGRDLIALDRTLRRGAGEEGGAPTGEVDPEMLNEIFRGAHSLKGLSGMFGFKNLTAVSHNLENLLDALRLGRVPLDASVLDLLFSGLDLLGRQIKQVGEAEPERAGELDAEEVRAFIERLNAAAGKSRAGAPGAAEAGIDPAVLAVLTEFEEHRLDASVRAGRGIYRARASFDLQDFDQGLAELTVRLKSLGEVITTLPGSAASARGRIDFDVVVATDQAMDVVREAIADLGAEVAVLMEGKGAAQAGGVSPAPSAPSRFTPPEAPATVADGDATLRSATKTVRVDIVRLDALMTIVGELALDKTAIQSIADQLREAGASSALLGPLAKASRSLGKKLTELQDRVMEVRMVPLSQAFDKMARTVRKLSRDAGKDVELLISGAETKLDKLIVEELVDPLMHIIRNAIDHGIEAPEARAAAGKPARGRVRLRAFQKGNHVVIEVEDDGRGLDFERVREVAVSRGLLAPEAPPLKPREAFDLLCQPGFTTRTSVSEISGRGVGMDVVRTAIVQLSGAVDFESTPGAGTTIVITLPMTLAIIQALVVSSRGRTYAIPLNQVQESLLVSPGEIATVERREVIRLRERTLPIARLNRLFGLKNPEGWRPGGLRADGSVYVVVVGIGERSLGLIVDDLVGQQDLVIKSMGELLKGVRGIAGAADLGNQQTILVVDVGTLIREAIGLEAGRREAS